MKKQDLSSSPTGAKASGKQNIRNLALCGVLIALSTVLSFIKIYEPPLGGGVTLFSMVPIALLSCMLGLKWGFGASFAYSLIQLFISMADVLGWGLKPEAVIATFLFDYILAYVVLGLAGIFRKKGTLGVILGIVIAVTARFVVHYFTGVYIFDIWMPDGWNNIWFYSLCYNGAYMLPEIILTTIATVILFKNSAIKKLILGK